MAKRKKIEQSLLPDARPVIGYCRVSTVDQAEKGASLPAQEQNIRDWAARNGRAVSAIYVDAGISGSRTDNRPELQRALDHAEQACGALVFYSLSRVSRSVQDILSIAERLEQAGADLVSLSENIDTTSAGGKMVFRMLAVFAQYERDLVSERTRAALAGKRHRGEYTGGQAPMGWKHSPDGRLVPWEEERALCRRVAAMRSQVAGYAKIVEVLAREGVVSRRGMPYTLSGVHRLIQAALAEWPECEDPVGRQAAVHEKEAAV